MQIFYCAEYTNVHTYVFVLDKIRDGRQTVDFFFLDLMTTEDPCILSGYRMLKFRNENILELFVTTQIVP